LEREALLHDNGDANSPLRQLYTKYAQANGNPTPAYPTYVLVDPDGVIRDYILGANLNEVQASLASKTGKTLNKAWNHSGILYTGVGDPSVGSASFTLWDGTTVSMPGPGGHLENQYAIFDATGPGAYVDLRDKLGDPITDDGGTPVRDHTKEFDLHSPIAMTFRAAVSPAPGSYRKVQVYAAQFVESSDFYPPNDFGQAFQPKGQAPLNPTYTSDGSIQVSFTPSDSFEGHHWPGPDDDGNASNSVSILYAAGQPILPYQSALDLADSVNADGSLLSTTKSTVTSLLSGGRSKLGNRDYAGSAQQFGKAQSTLAAAGSSLAGSAGDIKDHVAWLGTHYNI